MKKRKLDYRLESNMKSSSAWIGAGWVFLLLLALAGCGRQSRMGKEPTSGTATAIAVETATVKMGDLAQSVEVTGSLKAFEDVILSPKIAGKVMRVYVREGDRVSAGQIVVEQDTSDLRVQLEQAAAGVEAAEARLKQALTAAQVQPDLTDAQIRSTYSALLAAQARLRALKTGARPQERQQVESEVAAAKAQYEWAKIDYENTKRLYEQGAVSKALLDAKWAAFEAASAQYRKAQQALNLIQEGTRQEEIEAAEQQVRQAEAAYRQAIAGRSQLALRAQEVSAARAALAQAKANYFYAKQQLENASIRAPFQGAVAERFVNAGMMAAPGTPLLRLVSLQRLYFEAVVSETQIRDIRPGQLVKVRVDAYPNKPFTARVDRIYPAAGEAARDFKIRITLPNPKLRLKPGMFARGQVVVREFHNVPLTPKLAVLASAGKTRVFLAQEGKAVERPIRVIASDAEVVYADGVKAGDQVVVRGQDLLADGTPIQLENKRIGSETSSAALSSLSSP